MNTIKVGTRGSALALAQTESVVSKLKNHFPDRSFETVVIKTKGDIILDSPLSKIGDKGLFTKEIELELINGTIDMAVHSMKDMPTQLPDGLKLGGICNRLETNDVFISKTLKSLDDLKPGDRIATSSLRRKAQLLALFPGVKVVDIRGNVISRIKKLDRYPNIKGTILAYAGVKRLKMENFISEIIPHDTIIPAVGQAALAIEIRKNDPDLEHLMGPLNDENTGIRVKCERKFLEKLEGGCQVPVGAHTVINGDRLSMTGMIASPDGTVMYKEQMNEHIKNYKKLAEDLAEHLLAHGGKEILFELQWNRY